MALDASQTAFVRIGGIGGNPSPNLGSVTEIGPVAAPFDVRAGLDITSENQVYASLDDSFYVINRTTGIATEIGAIGAVTTVEDIAVLNVSTTMYLLTDDNRLLRIKSHSPSTTLSDVAITGLERAIDGEEIVAIDVRPATGGLYGLSNFARLYSLNPVTGVATKIGAPNAAITGLTGFSFGIDFDRVLDELRIVSDTQSNFRVDPDTLAVTQHTSLEEMGIVAIAYSYYDPNNDPPELFGIDSLTDNLVLIGGIGGTPSADNGAVTTVRDIDMEVPPRAGLDMSPVDDTLFMAARISGDDGLYTIIRGVANRVGDPIVNDGGPVIGLAIATPGFVGFPIRGLIGQRTGRHRHAGGCTHRAAGGTARRGV